METIQTYICNKKLLALQFTGAASNEAISVSDGVVRAKIVPVGEDPRKCIVNAGIIKEETNLVLCIREKMADAVLSWERKLVGLDLDLRLSRYITVKANVPDLPCHWSRTNVYTINLSPADHHIVFDARPNTAGGVIPGNKSDANPLKTNVEFDVTERTLIPGELLQLAWTLKVDDKIHTSPVMGSWYALPLITGGKVISKDEETNMYTVKVQGVSLVCLPTDWAGYQVGDWVFVLKPEYEGTLKPKEYSWDPDEYLPYIDDTREYGSNNISQPTLGDTGYRILPLNVDFFGNANGDFEKKEMATSTPAELDKAFKTTQHTGIITAVDHETKTASVTIDDPVLGGFFADVPIFYHCPDETTTENGPGAFAENDEVIVLNEGGGSNPSAGDLSVIGFKSELKECAYIFHIVRDDGVVMTDEYIELEYDGIYAATINREYALFTGVYDPVTELWRGKFEFAPSVDISGGLFIFINEIWQGKTLLTQYPYKYTSAAHWQPEDRIFPGRYEVAIPYWNASGAGGVYESSPFVDAVNPGKYSDDQQEADLWELRDLVYEGIDLPPYFLIKYRNPDGSFLGYSKPFFTNGGEVNTAWKITSSVPFTTETEILNSRSVCCPDTSYPTFFGTPIGSYMPCGVYTYRPNYEAMIEDVDCWHGWLPRVDPVNGVGREVTEGGCLSSSRYNDEEVDALIRQGKVQVTCINGTVVDLVAARADDPANIGVRKFPGSNYPSTFNVIKNEENPPFAMPVTPIEISFTGKIKETTTYVSHEVCCRQYYYEIIDGFPVKRWLYTPATASYVATGKNVGLFERFIPIQV